MRNVRHSQVRSGVSSSSPVELEPVEPRLLLSVATFAPAVNYATGDWPAAIASGDFNGDGKLDLVTANESGGTLTAGSISILLNNGDGTFGTNTDIATDIDPVGVAVGDFNDDGKADIAVINYESDSVNIFLGNGNGTFQAKRTFGTMPNPTAIAVGDFNGDGTDDLAVGSTESDLVNVYLCNSNGGITLGATKTVTSPMHIAVGDFGNGHADLAVSSQTNSGDVAVLLGSGNGSFANAQQYAVGYNPVAVTAGDFNHDAIQDLAVTSNANSTLCILLGNGNGTFQAENEFDTGLDPNDLALADLNLDLKPDLAVVAWGDNALSIMQGDNAGNFTAQDDQVSADEDPVKVVAGDFNGDGRTDLAVANNGSANISILLNVGPTASDIASMINKNSALKMPLTFFSSAFSDPDHLPMQQLIIDTLPAHGVLKLKSAFVTAGQVIPASQLSSLSYVINKDYAGADSFEWQGTNGTANSNLAMVTLITTPEATISTVGNAVEGSSSGGFTIQLNHASLTNLTIKFSASGKAVGGKNYVKLPKSVTIPAGQTSVAVAVTPLVDGVAKGDLPLTIKLASSKGYTLGLVKSTTVTIVDDEPKVGIAAFPADTTLGGAPAVVTFTRTGDTSQAKTITIVVKGTAKSGKDYVALPVTVTFDAGDATATLDVQALVDPTKTKTLQITAKPDKTFSIDPFEAYALVDILHV